MRLTSHLLLSLVWVFIFAIILLPLLNVFGYWSDMSWSLFTSKLLSRRVVQALLLTMRFAAIATLINLCFGVIISFVLSKYDFIGKSALDICINLPLCIPTAVSGIALSYLYSSSGLLGSFFDYWGIRIVYTDYGILVAMIFVSVPFVIRSVLPSMICVRQYEEAAQLLGAYDIKIFFSIILPNIWHALISGSLFSFARCVGEYGAIIFIAGNVPYVSESISVVIFGMLEQHDYVGISVVSGMMILLSFLLLLIVSYIQRVQKTPDLLLNT